jgi:hypothetical protein
MPVTSSARTEPTIFVINLSARQRWADIKASFTKEWKESKQPVPLQT